MQLHLHYIVLQKVVSLWLSPGHRLIRGEQSCNNVISALHGRAAVLPPGRGGGRLGPAQSTRRTLPVSSSRRSSRGPWHAAGVDDPPPLFTSPPCNANTKPAWQQPPQGGRSQRLRVGCERTTEANTPARRFVSAHPHQHQNEARERPGGAAGDAHPRVYVYA